MSTTDSKQGVENSHVNGDIHNINKTQSAVNSNNSNSSTTIINNKDKISSISSKIAWIISIICIIFTVGVLALFAGAYITVGNSTSSNSSSQQSNQEKTLPQKAHAAIKNPALLLEAAPKIKSAQTQTINDSSNAAVNNVDQSSIDKELAGKLIGKWERFDDHTKIFIQTGFITYKDNGTVEARITISSRYGGEVVDKINEVGEWYVKNEEIFYKQIYVSDEKYKQVGISKDKILELTGDKLRLKSAELIVDLQRVSN